MERRNSRHLCSYPAVRQTAERPRQLPTRVGLSTFQIGSQVGGRALMRSHRRKSTNSRAAGSRSSILPQNAPGALAKNPDNCRFPMRGRGAETFRLVAVSLWYLYSHGSGSAEWSANTPALQPARGDYAARSLGLRPQRPFHGTLRHLHRVGCPMSASQRPTRRL
jgi:hypothetical protein